MIDKIFGMNGLVITAAADMPVVVLVGIIEQEMKLTVEKVTQIDRGGGAAAIGTNLGRPLYTKVDGIFANLAVVDNMSTYHVLVTQDITDQSDIVAQAKKSAEIAAKEAAQTAAMTAAMTAATAAREAKTQLEALIVTAKEAQAKADVLFDTPPENVEIEDEDAWVDGKTPKKKPITNVTKKG